MKLDEMTKQSYLRSQGLLDPPLTQLWNFVRQLFSGDLGRSLTVYPKVPIATILSEKIPVTAAFGAASLVLGMVLGILLGLMMVRYKERLGDHLGTLYIIFVRAVPSLIYLFLIQVGLSSLLGLPLVFYADRPSSWILPTICLSLSSIAWYGVWLRRFMADELNKDYVKFAYVKGLSTSFINRKHIFRNAIVPIAIYLPSDVLFYHIRFADNRESICHTWNGRSADAVHSASGQQPCADTGTDVRCAVRVGRVPGRSAGALVDPRIRLSED